MLEGLQNVIKADSAHSTKVDCNSSVEEYINKSDWRINANANTGYSSAGLVNNLAGKLIANYWLDKVYNKREGDAHRNGDYHIHDLDILGAYCCGHDLMRLLNEGFNGVTGRVSSHAPKHFREALYQMANYIGILQSEWAGAQAFSSFDTYLAPYVFFDMNFLGITVDDVKKAIKNFVFNLNVPSRWGQSPFSNVTIDVTVPNDLKDLPPNRNNQPIFLDIYEEYKDRLDKDEELSKKWNRFMTELRRRLSIGGTDEDLLYAVTYKDFLPEMEIIDIAFYEVLNEGDINGMPFTFPIPTINITEDFDWNSRVANVIFENAAKYGSSYFQNFIGSQYKRNPITGKLERDPNAYKPNDVRSMAFMPTEEFIYRDANGRISKNEIRHLVNIWSNKPVNKKPHYEFMFNGRFYKITDMFKIDYSDYNKECVEIKLKNGYNHVFSLDHKCVVLNDENKIVERLSQDIKAGDRFLVAKNAWSINNGIGNYESGKIIGYYIAEGFFNHKEDNRLHFAINIRRNDIVNDIIDFFTKLGCEVKDNVLTDVNCHDVVVYGRTATAFVSQFVRGDKAKNKRLNTFVWNTSDDFRRGIYDGYLDTDGSKQNKNFAHTTNKMLCRDLIMLVSSLGKILTYRINDKNGHYFKPDKSDFKQFTSYKLDIRQYETFNDDKLGEFYIVPVKEAFVKKVSKLNTVYNFTIDTDEHLVQLTDGVISHQCCRLQLDKTQLRKRGGGLFGADAQTGSVGVVTINMARLGYLYKGDEKLLVKKLDTLMELAKSTLEKKRKFVVEMNKRGLYPYTRRYLKTFDTFFSTIGVNGMNEMVRNFTNDEYNITDPRGKDMCLRILDHIREKLLIFQEETGNLYNLEATPGEGTTYRFAKEDKKRFDDIIQAGVPEAPYYTNSSQIPVNYTADAFEALDLQDELQCKYTGGTVLHLYMSEPLSSTESCKKLVKSVLTNYRLPYVSVTPTYSICPIHGYIPGEHEYCPYCDKEIITEHAEEVDMNS